jgi:ATP-dependent protease ClpP protease subunit
MQDIYSNRWTTIQAAADKKSAVIKVEGIIGIPQAWLSDERRQEDVKATRQEMQNEIKRLKNLKVETIELHINSYGGDVNHGIAMYEALLESGAEITCRIYGHTASIATVIAMAAPLEKRTASINAMGLIHEGRGGVYGTVKSLMSYAQWLEKINGQIADIYAKSTKLSREDALEIMSRVNGEGEWMTSSELKNKGIISDTFEPMTAVASYVDEINQCGFLPQLPASVFNPPANEQPQLAEVIEKATNVIIDKIKGYFNPEISNSNNKADMDATKFAALFAVLGLSAMESTKDGVYISMEQAEQINTALAEAVSAKANATTAQNERNQVLNALDEIDPTVMAARGHEAKVNAIKAKLAAKPGAAPTQNDGGDGSHIPDASANLDPVNEYINQI